MFEIDEFHFLRPSWLIIIPIFYWLIFISYNKFFKIGRWDNLFESNFLHFLSIQPSYKRKDYLPWILYVSVTLFLVSLAGPVWEKIPQPIFKKKIARVIVLDLSYSMLAKDILPSRIDRVRYKLVDLLKRFKEGETGLICYAGDAFVISPLTNDPATIASMLPGLNPDIMPVPGSNPDIAIKLAVKLISQSKINNGHIILVTDGIREKFVSNIKTILGQNNLSILSVGTESGSPINLPEGNFLKDKKGNIVIPKLNKKPLIRLSNLSNVTLSYMSIDDNDIEKIILSESKSKEFEEDTKKRKSEKWKEEGPWLLLIALPLASLLFRKGVLFCLSFFIFSLLFNIKSVKAFEWDDLWLRADKRAEKLFNKGEMEKASNIFENKEWKGVAAYRSGNYEKAIENFSKLDLERSTFNLANSYAMSGRLDKSLEIYEKLLEKFPEHKDAKYNKELIEKLINEKKKEKHVENKIKKKWNNESEKNNKGQEINKKNKNTNQKNNETLKQQNFSNKNNIDENQTNINDKAKSIDKNKKNLMKDHEIKNSESHNNKKKTSLQKDSFNSKKVENQLLEQWLRKIPDDPGRLLRNKMQFEFKRRGNKNFQDSIYW